MRFLTRVLPAPISHINAELFYTFYIYNFFLNLNSDLKQYTDTYLVFYMDNYYNNLILFNITLLSYTINKIFYVNILITKLLKLNFCLFIYYSLFFFVKNSSYVQQHNYTIKLLKIFYLNDNEKELGSFDDFYFFLSMFISVITAFIISTIFILILDFKIYL